MTREEREQEIWTRAFWRAPYGEGAAAANAALAAYRDAFPHPSYSPPRAAFGRVYDAEPSDE